MCVSRGLPDISLVSFKVQIRPRKEIGVISGFSAFLKQVQGESDFKRTLVSGLGCVAARLIGSFTHRKIATYFLKRSREISLLGQERMLSYF